MSPGDPPDQPEQGTKPGAQRSLGFTLLDLMILVGMTGIGLAIARVYEGTIPEYYELAGDPWLHANWQLDKHRITGLTVCLLAPWTLAVLLLRFLRSRYRAGPLARQPGVVACAAASLMISIEVAQVGFESALVGFVGDQYGYWYFYFLNEIPWSVGASVAGAWLALVLVGSWRPEPSWLDRGGRVLGVVWIALMLVLRFTTVIFNTI